MESDRRRPTNYPSLHARVDETSRKGWTNDGLAGAAAAIRDDVSKFLQKEARNAVLKIVKRERVA